MVEEGREGGCQHEKGSPTPVREALDSSGLDSLLDWENGRGAAEKCVSWIPFMSIDSRMERTIIR